MGGERAGSWRLKPKLEEMRRWGCLPPTLFFFSFFFFHSSTPWSTLQYGRRMGSMASKACHGLCGYRESQMESHKIECGSGETVTMLSGGAIRQPHDGTWR